jgi:hypothetical protein
MPEKKERRLGADIAYEKAAELLKSGRKGLGKLGRRVSATMPRQSELDSWLSDKVFLGERDPEHFSLDMKATRALAKRRRMKDALAREDSEARMSRMSGLRGGGRVKMGYKKGGSVKAKSIDGIAQRGKTRAAHR